MLLPVLKGPFTVDTYQRLGELGVLAPDARVELIDGQVVEMTPIGDRHAACVRRLNRLLTAALGDAAIVDVQNPVVLGRRDVPQPDVTVLKARADGYQHHPRAADILLAIEVADTSLAYDRDVKMPRYAAAGIPEAWLVDLDSDTLTIFLEPGPDGYRDVRAAVRGDTLRPTRLPGTSISVAEILG